MYNINNEENYQYRIKQLEKVLELIGNELNKDLNLKEKTKKKYISLIQKGIPFNQQF